MVVIKDIEMPSDCYDCPFAKNKRTNDYGSFCECGILEDYETINLYEHSKHPNCPLVEIEERKVGKWEYKQLEFRAYGVVCTNCGYVIYRGYDFTSMEEFKDMVERKLQDPHITMDKFCCKCGAEMRGCENDSN